MTMVTVSLCTCLSIRKINRVKTRDTSLCKKIESMCKNVLIKSIFDYRFIYRFKFLVKL